MDINRLIMKKNIFILMAKNLITDKTQIVYERFSIKIICINNNNFTVLNNDTLF